MTFHLAVLGGSTPFTAAFFVALAERSAMLPPLEVRLFGRNEAALETMRRFGEQQLARCSGRVLASTRIDSALVDVDVVLHQIRYGGMEGRRDDEILCHSFGLPYDETLGLGGLNGVLRTAVGMKPIGDAMARYCPDAWIVNLTNPLSAVTTMLHRLYGFRRILGVCELPMEMAGRVASLLEIDFKNLEWSYSGLNHRGFLHDLRVNERDALEDVAKRFTDPDMTKWTRELSAVPLKYYRLLREPVRAEETGRAGFLMALAQSILGDLAKDPSTVPPRLAARPMPWYCDGVMPVLLAIAGVGTGQVVASVPNGTLATPELRIHLTREGASPLAQPPPPMAVMETLEPLVLHEAAVVRAAMALSKKSIAEAVCLDPLIAAAVEKDCVVALAERWS